MERNSGLAALGIAADRHEGEADDASLASCGQTPLLRVPNALAKRSGLITLGIDAERRKGEADDASDAPCGETPMLHVLGASPNVLGLSLLRSMLSGANAKLLLLHRSCHVERPPC